MKKSFLLSFLLVAGSTVVCAQVPANDSLFVEPMVDGWMLMQEVGPGENIALLARRYFVPPATLAASNAKSTTEVLRTGSTLFIPLAAYNLTRRPPSAGQVDVRPLYYSVAHNGERLSRIGRAGGVGERDLQNWNGLNGEDLQKGQTLLVGGLRYDATGTYGKKQEAISNPDPETITGTGAVSDGQANSGASTKLGDFIMRTDVILGVNTDKETGNEEDSLPEAGTPLALHTQPKHSRSAEALAFEELAAAGVGFVAEKGTAVFFTSRSVNTIYAFHNTAGRGSVIKITNPLNGRAVYAKVLGPLPPTPLYHKALLGISSKAQKLLGSAGDTRMWCEVAYVGY